MNTKNIRPVNTVAILLLCIMCGSCKKDFLGVSEKLAPELTLEKVFSNPGRTRQFYANIYSGVPNSSFLILDITYTGATGLRNPWPAIGDELKAAQGNMKDVAANGYNAGNAAFTRWGTLYQLIRQANVFIENVKPILLTGSSSGSLSDFISEDEAAEMKNYARFFRAYYHYLLFELYGPVPIMDKSVDPSNPNLDFERNSVDEVVNFINNELTEVIPQLPVSQTAANRFKPTRGVALAVKAKLWMYAASPLFNGGYSEALQLKNTDGKLLFPAADPGKWQKAKAALEEFLNFADGNYSLFKVYTGGVYDPDQSLYRLFIDVDGNNEIIWANPNNTAWGSLSVEGTDRRQTPRSERAGLASLGVSQALVDAFFMRDGLPITASPLYEENGFSDSDDDPTGRTTAGTFKMWVNREPRFYQTVMYQGRKYPISNNPVEFQKGSGNDNSAQDNPYTGYLLFKRLPRNTRNEGSYPKTLFRPSIVFRLAEFYLLYAEACNEVNPGDPNILKYIDMVRERAGIPKLADINPGLSGNKEALREAIQAESRVELAIEGQRYFDVRRWMIAEKPIAQGGTNGPLVGMDMNSPNLTIGPGGFFNRVVIENRPFNRAMYLYPISLTEIQKSRLLVQNPGW